MSFTVTPLSPVLGAEVVGLDLSRPVDDADFARVRDAFHANGLLVFRDQSLSPDQQIAFSRRFRSEEHTSELQSLMRISYAVFCLKKKNNQNKKLHYNYNIKY